MKIVLTVAGCYNLAWGAFLILAPQAAYRWGGLWTPESPLVNVPVWQCLGMVIGCYGVGYLIAGRDPVRHWGLVAVGLLGKVLGPIGCVDAALKGTLPWSTLITNFFNDFIWWVPFGLILARAWAAYRDDEGAPPAESPEVAMTHFRTQRGETLAELSRSGSVLLIFLRHMGCSFCREAMADAAARRGELAATGTKFAFVHLVEEAEARPIFAKYGLDDVDRIADPNQDLYRAFQLRRAPLSNLFQPKTLARFVQAVRAGHFQSSLQGDGFRLGGAFLLRDGRIVKHVRYATMSDRPDYCELARG